MARRRVVIGSGSVLGSLVLVVAVVAGGVLAPAPSSDAASLQSRSTSCAGWAFQPLDSLTYAGFTAAGLRYGSDDGGGSGIFVCDPKLPSRAIVTSVRFVLWDDSAFGEVQGCGLYRTGSTSTGGPAMVELGSTPATGIDARPRRTVLRDTSIASATVNASTWGYWLQCQVHFPVAEGRRFDVGIISAHVNYQVDPTKA